MQSLESLLLVRRVVHKGLSKKALESIERLFNEPFEPQWAIQKRNEANEELADFIKSCNKAFQQEAVKSLVRIMATTDNACNYSNPM
jgi:hypothetical protein